METMYYIGLDVHKQKIRSGRQSRRTNGCHWKLYYPVGVPHRMDEEGNVVPSKSAAEPPASPDLPDPSSVVRYAYQYDSHGNWTPY